MESTCSILQKAMRLVVRKKRCLCAHTCAQDPDAHTLPNRGRVIKELGLRRTDIIVSTKLFWGPHEPQNNMGLSRKQYVFSVAMALLPYYVLMPPSLSIVEGTRESLKRLGLNYVDIIFAHRPDSSGALQFASLIWHENLLTVHECSPDRRDR